MNNPAETSELLGHTAALQHFYDQMETGRLHHAYLVSGVEGIGKATFAFQCAKLLVSGGALYEPEPQGLFASEAPAALMPDMEHPAIHRVVIGTHPDVMHIMPEEDKREITVEQVRAIKDFFAHTASESPWRVVIVDSADALNGNAANSLLKSLEEPPARGILFLVHHTPRPILPTIRSRCMAVTLAPLSETECQQVLAKHSEIKSDEATRHFAYALGEGSPGQMQRLLMQDAWGVYRAVMKNLTENHAGKTTPFFISKDTNIRILQHVVLWILTQQARVQAGMVAEHFGVAGEEVIYQPQRDVRATLDTWDHALSRFRAADGLHLDAAAVINEVLARMAA